MSSILADLEQHLIDESTPNGDGKNLKYSGGRRFLIQIRSGMDSPST